MAEHVGRRLRLLTANARFDAGHRRHPGRIAIVEHHAGQRQMVHEPNGNPDVRRNANLRAEEIAAHDADHRDWIPVQTKYSSNRLGIPAEPFLPHPVTENGDGMRVAFAIV